MRKKCKVCGAPLDCERCDYCGTNHGVSKQSSSHSENVSNDGMIYSDLPNNDIPSNDIPGFETPMDHTYSQSNPSMEPKRKTGLAILMGVIGALLVAGSIWFVLSLSDNSLDAFELLQRSHAVQEDVESMIMDIHADINMSMPGMSMDIPLTMRMEVENEDRMLMDMSISMLGMDMTTTTFLRDGYEYTEEIEFGIANRSRNAITPVDSLEMLEFFDMFNFDADSMLESMITDSSASRIDDGYRLEFELDLSGLMSSFGALAPLMMDDLFDFTDMFDGLVITLVMYLDGDYMLTSMELLMAMEIDVEGTMADMNMNFVATMVQVGDVTIDFPYWLDEMETSDAPGLIPSLTPETLPSDFENSALLGYWENGSGTIFLWVFERADSVEFLANGTVVITENGRNRTESWAPNGTGSFTANGDSFTYSIIGDVLTITDSANDSWSFDRADSATPANDRRGDEISAVDILGNWEWDIDGDFIYNFNADGTATRGFSDGRIDFEWEITNGNVINMHIGNWTEQWEAVLINDTLTLSDLNGHDVWSYVRND